MEDWQLLRKYADQGSEPAFRELMERYLGLVYGTAQRCLGDAQAAEDVAQAVFCLLAKKAPQLKPETSLAGWVYQTAFFLAIKRRESEQRRRRREQESACMQMEQSSGEAGTSWNQIAPILDEAISQLSEKDRQLVLLRFFQGAPLRKAGQSQGLSEDAARMRINRALEKMRDWMRQHGVATSAATLACLLTDNAAQAVPAPIAESIQNSVVRAVKMPKTPSLSKHNCISMKSFPFKT